MHNGKLKILWPSIVLSAAAIGHAHAIPIDAYFTVNPISVCDDAGANCTTANTYAPQTQSIYAQAGVAAVFLPTTQVNKSALLSPDVTSSDLILASVTDPLGNGQVADASTINMWFLKTIPYSSGTMYGWSWTNGNGVTINSTAVDAYNNGAGRMDTVAHELGHNFGLGHATFGAGGASNLMTSGGSRTPLPGLGDIAPSGANLDQLSQVQIDQIRCNMGLTCATNSPNPYVKIAPKVTVDIFGSTPFMTNNFFSVSFSKSSPGVYLKSMTIDLAPVDAFFDPTNNPPGFAGSPFLTSGLLGLADADINLSGITDGDTKLTLTFANDAFVKGDSFKFGIDIDMAAFPDFFGAEPSQLAGALFSFAFSDGFGSLAAMSGRTFAADSTDVVDLVSGITIDPASLLASPPGFVPPANRSFDDIDSVPEPGSAVLMLIGLAFLGFVRLRIAAVPALQRVRDRRRRA